MLNHKSGVENKVANVLSHIGCLLHTIMVELIGFDILKGTYSSCPDFGPIYSEFLAGNRRSNVFSTLSSMTVICFKVLNYASPKLHSRTF